MEPIADITAARRVMRQYLAHAEGKLPDDTFEQLETLSDSPSPVDQIVRTADLLYARRDELDDAGRTAGAQLASFAAVNAWHGMGGASNRGGLIAQALLRDIDAGEVTSDDADPAPAPGSIRQPETIPAGATVQ